MSGLNPSIEKAIRAFQCLPGVGRKTATRMVLYLLEGHIEAAETMASAISEVLLKITKCSACQNFADTKVCDICKNPNRRPDVLCVVESAADLVAVEDSAQFDGKYFVLHGLLSPIDGRGPVELGTASLIQVVRERQVQEVILALDTTVEGEATSHYIQELLSSSGTKVSRIAHGIPVGGELGYVSSRTIALALEGRNPLG